MIYELYENMFFNQYSIHVYNTPTVRLLNIWNVLYAPPFYRASVPSTFGILKKHRMHILVYCMFIQC